MLLHFSFELAIALAAAVCGVVAAITDFRSRRIPNWLTGTAMVAGLTLHLLAGGWRELGSSCSALLICGAVFLLFNLAGGMGGGDVKLIAAEGCLLGLANVVPLLICTAICGGVLAIGLAVSRGRLRQTLSNVLALTFHHSRHGLVPHPELNVLNSSTLRLPYAFAIAAGSMLTICLQPSLWMLS